MAGKVHQMMWLGKKIRQAREQAGLTQTMLADLIGVGRTAIARWENGDIEPKLKNLIALANQPHVSTDYLLGVEEKSLFDKLDLSETARNAFVALVSEIRKGRP